MARYYYLFDASALVALLLKSPGPDALLAKRRLLKLLAPKDAKEGPRFFVPNICMAECSSALAKIFLGDGHTDKKEAAYRQHIELLLDWVSSKKKYVIKTYKLKRSHLVDIENVFVADRRLPMRNGHPLSGHDGIIIAMGCALEEIAGKGKAIILTTDARMVDVCNHHRDDFPHAVNIATQEIPGA